MTLLKNYLIGKDRYNIPVFLILNIIVVSSLILNKLLSIEALSEKELTVFYIIAILMTCTSFIIFLSYQVPKHTLIVKVKKGLLMVNLIDIKGRNHKVPIIYWNFGLKQYLNKIGY